MVLELGGENVSLRGALLSVRSPIEVPDEPSPPELLPAVEPVVEKPVLAVLRTATLSGGQTLYGLAQEHLGSGNRWPELLELNQWTEEDALRLPPGTKVKLPDN